ncbi:unnamed protein product [Vitrella brassicaformis CCMP3155]|uniref:Uncharacterized protein n=1 Tax=Vitrella brassicaformis (strain CCMP3155) TaxID=1169540 RepID=A0A0G4E9F8_VITBC|nr:unnamed protein product [Vitrella brassicaformis CCMP3155]|eukprot:CEL91873.1 unnamed protein product [Vitrella brassicaformis CCMP3155]
MDACQASTTGCTRRRRSAVLHHRLSVAATVFLSSLLSMQLATSLRVTQLDILRSRSHPRRHLPRDPFIAFLHSPLTLAVPASPLPSSRHHPQHSRRMRAPTLSTVTLRMSASASAAGSPDEEAMEDESIGKEIIMKDQATNRYLQATVYDVLPVNDIKYVLCAPNLTPVCFSREDPESGMQLQIGADEPIVDELWGLVAPQLEEEGVVLYRTPFVLTADGELDAFMEEQEGKEAEEGAGDGVFRDENGQWWVETDTGKVPIKYTGYSPTLGVEDEEDALSDYMGDYEEEWTAGEISADMEEDVTPLASLEYKGVEYELSRLPDSIRMFGVPTDEVFDGKPVYTWPSDEEIETLEYGLDEDRRMLEQIPKGI